MRTNQLLAAIALLSVGCANELTIHERHEEGADHDVAFVGQDDDLLAQLTLDEEGFSITPLIDREPFNRVAFRFDANSSLEVQVRTRPGGDSGVLGEWADATLTYQDESANNAHADVADGSTAVQLRFRLPDEVGLSFLVIETFNYEPSLEEDAVVDVATPEEETQGLAADGLVVTRSGWGARPRSCGPRHTPQRLTIHHTVTPNNDSMSMPARMRQIQAFHIDGRGWCDVGYHFLIGQDGKVYQGRVENITGAHAANANTNNVGISFIGDFTSKIPPDNMLNAAAKIMKSMSRTYGITLNRTMVKGHRQVGTTSTSCPGNQLYNRLQNLIDRAKNASTSAGGSTGGGGGSDFCGASRTGDWCSGTSVVRCSNGRETSRTRCDNGCQVMPPGTPDRCVAAPAAPPAASGPAPSFSDVPADSWAFRAIEKLKEKGAVAGCGGGKFCPNDKLTRQGVAKILGILEAGSVPLTGVPAFGDVPESLRPLAREVVARGIMDGCEGNNFCPNGPVSRAAMAVYTRRATELTNHAPSTKTFSDVPLNHWASGAIERLAQRNDVSGCRSNPRAFCPSDDVTRAQAASMIAKAYGFIN
ncbi:MAG: N-acetylmuramoyl-L-alanine amidase [Deltaproteobacteria bacterium]|nr:N-acetylmuramoyl-L-alanine amidase [Deltaproteobacteria bacterium]